VFINLVITTHTKTTLKNQNEFLKNIIKFAKQEKHKRKPKILKIQK